MVGHKFRSAKWRGNLQFNFLHLILTRTQTQTAAPPCRDSIAPALREQGARSDGYENDKQK
jgi:hypothetical protein